MPLSANEGRARPFPPLGTDGAAFLALPGGPLSGLATVDQQMARCT